MAKKTQKTNSRAKKTIRNGKLGTAGRNHFNGKANGKSSRKKRKSSAMSKSDMKRLKDII